MNKKRILALIIALVMLCGSATCALAEDVAPTDKADSAMLGVLVSLGISDGTDSGFVSRATFAKAAAGLLGMHNLGYTGQLPFADVALDSDAYNAVGNLYSLGIISNAGEFYPDRTISENEAAKIVVSSLGYDDHAAAKGGYPTGYMAVASGLKLTQSFNGDSRLSIPEMTELLYCALEAEVRYVIIGGGEANANITALEQYHGLRRIEGQVTSVDRSSLTSPVGTEFENQIRVDDVLYDASKTTALNDSLGYRVAAYVSAKNSKDNKIYAFELLTENVVTLAATDAVADFASFTIELDNKKYSLSKDYQIIYNGVASDSLSADERNFSDGEYILIDSDNDNRYDVISIWRTEYVITDTFTYDGSVVTDQNRTAYGSDGKTLISLCDDEVFYDFLLPDGSQCAVSDLADMPALSVWISQNGAYIKVQGINNSVKGAVSGVGADSIEIDGQSYPFTDYARAQKWTPGTTALNVLLTSDGRVIGTSDEANTMKYGYIMAIKKLSSFNNYSVYMLCENGDKKTFEFKDNIVLDGSSVNSLEAIGDSRIHSYQFVKYQTDSENRIFKIDTESSDNLYEKNLDPDNSLRLYYDESFYWFPAEKMLTPRVAPVSASIFCVPTAMSTPDGIAAYKFNEGDFYVGGISDLGAKGSVAARIYDMTDTADCGAVLNFTDSNPDVTLSALDYDSPVGVVDKVTMVLDSDGNEVRQVTIAATTGFQKYYFSSLLNSTFEAENRQIKPGDVVRYQTMGNTITNLRVEFSRESWAMDPSVTDATDNNKNYRYSYTAIVYYHIGTLYNLTGSHALIRDEKDGLVSIVPYTEAVVLKYDKELGSIRPIDSKTALTECAAGSLANKAVAITRYAEATRLLVIYE